MKETWNRRNFMTSLGLGTIGAAMLPTIGWSMEEAWQDAVVKILAEAISIDMHNHVDVPFDTANFSNEKNALPMQMKTAGLSAIGMTFCVDRPKLAYKGEAFERFTTAMNEMDALLEANAMKRALTFKDWKKAKKQQQPIVIQAVEGGLFIEDDVDRLEVAYERGLRHFGLLHDAQSAFPLGDIYTNEPQFGGLTDLGKQVIKKASALGMVVDLAHCSDAAVNQAIELLDTPVLISHTGLNTQLGTDERMANMMMPRLISKEQAKRVAEADGVVGVWTHLANNTDDMAVNIAALVDVMGVDHVAIGTDTKMINPTKGEHRFGNATNSCFKGMENGLLESLVTSMLAKGFHHDEILKIIGGNYARIFELATT
ncbi:Zn-dependent dipeptidase, dipeptidase homolog [Pustulibacterium marinum]|uniref:Zn-dependent dipeptidase, dipeptidase homolog n=1 Tax=Pustulibacterium marinum TaxID=1224947 RepID=A0A1I7IML3_9FLAO|nr:membrane dipeptidase [Pustulibacterium marinum]SFU74152.1 Zn-dependent dipeptidase, dipeptidase homolog [Pustulibacterium marinum]